MYDVWCMFIWCTMYDVWCMMYDVWCMMSHAHTHTYTHTYGEWGNQFKNKRGKLTKFTLKNGTFRMMSLLTYATSIRRDTGMSIRNCFSSTPYHTYIIHYTSYIVHHTSYIIAHNTSYIIHRTPYEHTSHIIHTLHHTSHIIVSYIGCDMWYVRYY